MVIPIVVATLARGQDPAPDSAPDSAPDRDTDEVSAEVIVYGRMLVDQAREEVVDQLAELGFDDEVVDRGDYVVYRHDAPWKGQVRLYDDGWMQVQRQPLRVVGAEVPWAKRDTPLAWAGCLVYPWACLRVGGAVVSTRKWRGAETRTVDALQPNVRVWGDRVADLAVDYKIDGLPARLEALWDHGVPLDGSELLATYRQRRQAILDHWATRTETPWGDEIRRTLEGFCRGVIQPGDHPFTTAELAAFNQDRARPFVLVPPASP